jgi:hypothetical protein
MNRKQFLILLALVMVLGAAGLIIYRGNNNSWHGSGATIGQKLLPDLPINDVAQITIKSGAGEVNLTRRDNLWRVHERADYPANFQQISEMLMKFGDLKAVQNEDIGPSQLGRLKLLPPGTGDGTGTSIEFKDQSGKSLGSVLLGKKHMRKAPTNSQPGGMGDEGWPDGRYVMAGADKSVAVISDPLDNVQAKPEQWLSKDFLSVEKPSVIAVQFPEATNSWKLTRASETNDWQLANAKAGEKLDSSKISSVTSPFTSVNFSDVGALSTGNTVMMVDTFDGFSYTAKIGRKQDDNYPVSFIVTANFPTSRTPAKDEKPDDKAKLDKEFQTQQKTLADKLAKEQAFTHWTYQLPAYSIDEMLKTRQQLLEEASTNSPAQAQK